MHTRHHIRLGCLAWLAATLATATPFGIRTYENRYLSPQEEHSLQQVLHLGPWEQFEFLPAAGHGDDQGYLRSHKGSYISMAGTEVVQQPHPGPWEVFHKIYLPDGKVGFYNLEFQRYLSFAAGRLQSALHLRHWESFWLDWVDDPREPSTAVFLIEGNLPLLPPAKHGGLLFVDNYAGEEGKKIDRLENHFMHKNYLFGGDGMITGKMPLFNRKTTKLGDIPLTIWEAQEWVLTWAKPKKYRLATFNCWKLPIAFAKEFGLRRVKEPLQNDLLVGVSAALTVPLYPILTELKKI